MTRENIETLERALDAYNRRDREAFLAELHQDAETIPVASWPEPGPYVGPDVWNFHVAFAESWGKASAPRPTEIRDLGEKLLVRLERSATGGASGIGVDYAMYGVVTFRDGRIARMEWFQTRSEAVEAAGLNG
jgi:ketosteroid isomerase-like protein